MKGLIILVAGALAVVACGGPGGASDDDDNGGGNLTGYCGTYVSRLRECGLLGEGRFTCENYGDAAERCETACLREATCTEIDTFYCAFEGSVADCFNECIGAAPFTCDDGLVINWFAQCNGYPDCLGAEDELGCAFTGRWKCRNVDQFVELALFCDGNDDCSDGSDELPDCPIAVTCPDGLSISEALVCNGVENCVDGSDEAADCAVAASCI